MVLYHLYSTEPKGHYPVGEGLYCISHMACECHATCIYILRVGACTLLGSSSWCILLKYILVLQDVELHWCVTCSKCGAIIKYTVPPNWYCMKFITLIRNILTTKIVR